MVYNEIRAHIVYYNKKADSINEKAVRLIFLAKQRQAQHGYGIKDSHFAESEKTLYDAVVIQCAYTSYTPKEYYMCISKRFSRCINQLLNK